jgi:hypothetical protein
MSTTAQLSPPTNPAGEYTPEANISAARRDELIAAFAAFPAQLKQLLSQLAAGQLDTLYKNWTIRQIVHHLADSHVNTYMRFKVALTEDNPIVKPYDETLCAELPDAKSGDIGPAVALFEAVHSRLVQALLTMSDADFARTYCQPQYNKTFRLDEALNLYVWHSRHHLGQIEWIMENRLK